VAVKLHQTINFQALYQTIQLRQFGWILKLPFQAILPIRRTCTYTEADPDDPGLNSISGRLL
jgi:hypothetical protein